MCFMPALHMCRRVSCKMSHDLLSSKPLLEKGVGFVRYGRVPANLGKIGLEAAEQGPSLHVFWDQLLRSEHVQTHALAGPDPSAGGPPCWPLHEKLSKVSAFWRIS